MSLVWLKPTSINNYNQTSKIHVKLYFLNKQDFKDVF